MVLMNVFTIGVIFVKISKFALRDKWVVMDYWSGRRFDFFDKSRMTFVRGKQNAESYYATLYCYLQPMMNVHVQSDQNILFEQNNASVYTAKITQVWVTFNFILVLDWSALFSDLNPIEIVYDVMVTDMYRDGKK